MVEAERWDRLAEHVVLRRLNLGYRSQQQFAHAAGISVSNISKIERSIYRPGRSLEVLVKLQHALGWQVGSIQDVLAGGQPTEHPSSDIQSA